MSENSLLAKIEGLYDKFNMLQEQLSDPDVMSDMKKFVQLNKEYKELDPIVKAGAKFKKMVEDNEALAYAARVGAVLAYYKLEDTAADEKGLKKFSPFFSEKFFR